MMKNMILGEHENKETYSSEGKIDSKDTNNQTILTYS